LYSKKKAKKLIPFGKFNFQIKLLVTFLQSKPEIYSLLKNPIYSLLSILVFAFIFSSHSAFGQISPSLGKTDTWMKNAKAAMEQKDYKTANGLFRNLIDSGFPLPQEMPYLFAETLFELGQYDNSSNFLNKYLEISGFTGDHYEGAKELKKKLETPLNAIQICQLCDRRGYRYQTCFTCEGAKQIEQDCNYCKAKGVVGCSKCAGSGMITRVNIFKIPEYYECERCSGKGRLTCPVCDASKIEISTCKTCAGSGRLTSEHLCQHQEEDHQHE
jgi:tetratricopeptide (TPR) repeat protein